MTTLIYNTIKIQINESDQGYPRLSVFLKVFLFRINYLEIGMHSIKG